MWNLSLAKNGGIIISASNFKHPRMRKCCYYGAYQKEERAARITIGPICSRAFSQCCNLANHLWNETFHISVIVGRQEVSNVYTMSSNVCSIFLENWLWKVYHVPERHQLELMLPDFLTIWKIQGIGISNKVLNSETMAEAPAAILHYEVTLKIEARCQHGGTKR
nr:PREDICTED: complement C5-like [Equus przewalskii]XP_008517540.1 PREDICTED: complement C5-like [Equus przewalskii]